MKKVLLALAVIASMQVAGAQVKSVADAAKALSSAKEAVNNPKKAAKAATWLKLGNAYLSAYESSIGNVWTGATKSELALMLGKQEPTSTSEVELAGEKMTKEVYADKNLYFNQEGKLALVEVTNPVEANALEGATDSYLKAYALDNGKGKDVAAALETVSQKYLNEAYNQYQLGFPQKSSQYFEQAANVVANAPLSKIDTNSIYNAGVTAAMAQDTTRALNFFKKSLGYGYYGTDGEIYYKLAELDPTNAKSYLEEGFTKFPNSQNVLIGLINYYIEKKEDPQKLFVLLDKAKANDPDNASLYYVEGNIHKQLGEEKEAIASYRQATSKNPKYEFGSIGEGVLMYEKADALAEEMQKTMDNNKYNQMADEYLQILKDGVVPFEKAFETTQDAGVKLAAAEYLRSMCYRLQNEGGNYAELYNKYKTYVEENSK